jgi:UDP-N-acetylglucosamine--N-acetylmuramyl-(pentapeptide) pyrophosphoryl-undecaprenol N-acetylglucosamine transferase
MRDRSCIVVTGGGTAGHVYPALSVVEHISKRWPGRIVWIGSRSGMERHLLRDASLTYYGIPSGKWRRYLSLRNGLDIFKVMAGILYALVLLRRESPALLFSKGGYVSVPPVIAAWLLGIPIFTHESDYDPGLANRINSLFAEKVLVSFGKTESYFEKQKVVLTGNPIREAFFSGDRDRGRQWLGCPEGMPVILVLGGSLGSSDINHCLAEIIDELCRDYYVVHQMGADNYTPSSRSNYLTAPFWREELPDILAGADLVICRAGANSLSELSALAKPAILAPLPLSGSRGDQIRNAAFFEQQGAAVLFDAKRDSPMHLLRLVRDLFNSPDRLRTMSERMKSLGRPMAAQTIAEIVLERVK